MVKEVPIIRHYRKIETKVTECFRDSDGLLKFKKIKSDVFFEPIKE